MRKIFTGVLAVVLLVIFIGVAWAYTDKDCWWRCMRAGGTNEQCGMLCTR